MSNEQRQLVLLSEVQSIPKICWLWPDRLALGCLSLLEGDPGASKTLLTYDLVARLTTGRPMPLGEGNMPPAGAVILQGEDNLGVIRENLAAAGADPQRIIIYDKARFSDEPLLLPHDLPLVEEAVAKVSGRLLVIDPLDVFIAGNLNVGQDIRRALTPLAAWSERTRVAVLLVRHLAKRGGSNVMYRGAGSIAIVASVRSALLVANDAGTDPHQHVLIQTKTNLSSTAVSLKYHTLMKEEGLVIEWLGPSTYSAHDLASSGRSEQLAVAEAAFVLYSILVDGPVWAAEAIRMTRRAGVAKRTLDRAKQVLGVRSKKRGSGRGSRWYWLLPDDEARLRPFREMDLSELMDRQIYGTDDNLPPLRGDKWKRGHRENEGWDGNRGDDEDDEGQYQT